MVIVYAIGLETVSIYREATVKNPLISLTIRQPRGLRESAGTRAVSYW